MTVTVRNLSKSYGDVRAVSGVAFHIDAGEVLGLLGPNGAGKTTTVESVIGLIEPDAGEIEICGVNARRQPREARRRIGVALQSTGLQDKITPREALAAFAALYPNASAPGPLLERFGLTDKADARVETLSGGQRQRLALALAFLNDPQAVFLDEPTAGLDPQMRRDLHQHIAAMRAEGRAILITTHDMDEAEQLCDRVAVIAAGRIVAEGRPRELIAGSQGAISVRLQTSAPLDPGWATGPISDFSIEGDEARFVTADLNGALAELTATLAARGVQILNLRAGKATLEDVILDLTRGTGR